VIALWTVAGSIAAAAGPVASGALNLISWRMIFFINVPVGLGRLGIGPTRLSIASAAGGLRSSRSAHCDRRDRRAGLRTDRGGSAGVRAADVVVALVASRGGTRRVCHVPGMRASSDGSPGAACGPGSW